MTAIRPERLGADHSGSEKTGPEKYAPNRDVPERLAEVDQAAATAFEGEIREFVRRDVAFLRRQRSDVDTAAKPSAPSRVPTQNASTEANSVISSDDATAGMATRAIVLPNES